MYLPAHFEEKDTGALFDLIAGHPFGTLVTHGADGLNANHIPFELDRERNVLLAHVARANPVWQAVRDGDEVLAIFQAGNAYISPNWYPSKHEAHKQVPTWNYQVVHVYGRITIQDDEKAVRAIVAKLTKTHEASQPVPWKMSDSPREFIESMVKNIVGLEIGITRLVGKFKLNQNKEERDRLGAANALKETGAGEIADAMLAVRKI